MPEPYFSDSDMTLYQGDAVDVLRDLPAGSVHMACTSPPFFGLRDYGTGAWEGGDEGCDHKPDSRDYGQGRNGNEFGTPPGANKARAAFGPVCGKCGARRIDSQIGLESSPDEWAARLVDVFREVRRVLRDDGTLWVECGDSYAASAKGSGGDGATSGLNAKRDDDGTFSADRHAHPVKEVQRYDLASMSLKPKDLIGQPWLLAFALRADGWYMRSCIVWSKNNCMPESVADRPTTAHSYLFLLSKKPRYYFDAESLKEPHKPDGRVQTTVHQGNGSIQHRDGERWPGTGRNVRTVWEISTEPNALAICRVCDAYWQGGAPREHCGEPVVQHFAAFPRELVRRMILAGTSERGVCTECGAPWVREVERGELVGVDRGGNYRGHPVDDGVRVNPGRPGLSYQQTTLGWIPSCQCKPRGSEGLDQPGVWEFTHFSVPATVLDPFSGSGTSLLVARSLGRHAIGVELNERYCAMTKARTHQLSVLG